MPVLPSGNATSLSSLVQGFFNEAANQRSTGLALRNVLFEKQRDRDNRWFAGLQVAREHELRRKALHEQHEAAQSALVGQVAGSAIGFAAGGPAGAMVGGSIGSGTGMLAAGQPSGAGMVASSMMQAPGVMSQSRLSDQLFHNRAWAQDMDEAFGPLERMQGITQSDLGISRDRLALNLMSRLVGNPIGN